jgi:excisionase family DNA binding protein
MPMPKPIPMPEMPEPRFVGVPQAQVVLGLSRSSVYALLNDGSIRSVRVNGRRLIPVEELDHFGDELIAQSR